MLTNYRQQDVKKKDFEIMLFASLTIGMTLFSPVLVTPTYLKHIKALFLHPEVVGIPP